MFQDANLVDTLGWTFEEIDAADTERLYRLMIFKQVKHVAEFGGEFDL